jgi:hypothetical protein
VADSLTERLPGPALPLGATRTCPLARPDRPRTRATLRSPALNAVVGSRLIVWVAGLLAIYAIGENVWAFLMMDPLGVTAPLHSIPFDKLLAPGGRWDSVWYIAVASRGYYSPASTNFFPLYPLLIALGDQLVDQPLIVGMAISVAAMTVAMTLLRRLALLDFDERTASLTVALVALYPMSFFLSAVYTESLFLALSVGAFYAARTERWALAGLCAACASATRSDGVVLVLPLALLYLYGPRGREGCSPRRWWIPRFELTRSAGWLALAPAGLVAYMGYLTIAHGAPFAPFHAAEADWGRSFAGPFSGVVRVLGALPGDVHGLLAGATRPVGPGDPLSWNAHDLIDLGFLTAGVAALAASRRRVPMPYLVYAIVVLTYSSSFPAPNAPLQALPRYLLPVFPLFLGVASRLAPRRHLAFAVLGASALLLAVFSGLWAVWTLIP